MPDAPSTLIATILNSELIRWFVSEVMQFWKERQFEGTYKVNSHTSTLELLDQHGRTSIYTKKQTVTFTQNGVFAIQDQAWGDGDIFSQYTCSPGVIVDKYKEGYRWKVLISLQTTRNRNEQEEFLIERTIKDGFLTSTCNFQVQVDHPTDVLTLSVIFPSKCNPKSVMLIEQNLKKHHTLDQSFSSRLSRGRIQYQWTVQKPRLFESFILRWTW